MAVKHDILYVNFYTDGSAARKIAPAFPQKKPQNKPRVRKKKRIVVHVDPVAIASVLVATVMLVMMAVGLMQLQSMQAQAQAMENHLQSLELQNQQLTQQYWEGIDLKEVEKTAIALGMVPGEQAQMVPVQLDVTEQPTPSQTPLEQIIVFLTNLFA